MGLTKVTYSMIDGAQVNVKDFGAVGDGVTDDTAAIQAAIDYVGNADGGVIYFPSGKYLTTSTVTVNYVGISLIGEGGGPTPQVSYLIANHLSGPVLHIKKGRCVVDGLGINASAFRKAGTAGNNYGFLIEPVDTADQFIPDCYFARFQITNQPSHGLVASAGLRRTIFEQIYSNNNAGHAYAYTTGVLTGRVNKGNSGLIEIRSCSSEACGGHALAIGDPTENSIAQFRFLVENFEGSDCAFDAAFRYSNHQVFFKGQNSYFDDSAVRGIQPASSFSGGVAINGQDLRLKNTRFINTTSSVEIVTPGLTNRGIEIDTFYISNSLVSPQTYAIIVPSNVQNLRVFASSQITSPSYVDLLSANPLTGEVYENGVLYTTNLSISDTNGTRFNQPVFARRNVNDESIRLIGGNIAGQGGSLEFYGGAHPTYANWSLINGERVRLRSQDGSVTWLEAQSTGVRVGNGAWNGQPLLLGGYNLWVDSSGRLRIKSGAPSSDTDGTIVGTQS